MRKFKDTTSITKKHRRDFSMLKKKAKDLQSSDTFFIENRYLYSLLEITHSINIPQGLDRLLNLIVDSAITLSKAERGFLLLFHGDGNLEFKVTRNFDKETLESEDLKISKTVVNQVLSTGKPLYLSNIYKDDKFRITESIESLGLRMIMCVPLKTKEKLLGVIYVDSHSTTESFTQLEEKMFETFAAQASVAVENRYLYDSSVHDALTGLYNYGYLRARLEEEITRAARTKKDATSFIMIDLDIFKTINDSYGHLFGNSILVKIAECIKQTVRRYDIAARYGGDEFAVLMPGTDVQDARSLAQRLQKKIANLTFTVGKDTISVTVSIGISVFPPDKSIDSENIIVEADHALFIAKKKGGNQIAVFGLRKVVKKYVTKLVGSSNAIDEVRKLVSNLAKTDATILVTGETGTGKELITRLIHQESPRSNKPFVVVNCGAIPDNLLESELFGYEKGAFTGAYKQHKGKFEAAQGGTIFLDEIGDLPLHLQVKLLRVIEQKEIDRIGGKAPIKIDVRIIAASNRDLEEEVKKGNFRKDLFYRLSVALISIPPLRERIEDIKELSQHYLNQLNKRYHRTFKGFTKEGIEVMMHYSWPGNVRELIHRIERAVIIGTGQYLSDNDLGLSPVTTKMVRPLRELKDDFLSETIEYALSCNNWNVTHASKALGIAPRSLRRLIKKYKIAKHNKTLK
jgi:diguanylate cyclase (GGDEF)-like protein